jgi:cytochrome P450
MSAPDISAERLGADYFQDPYSVHARLRAKGPVTPVIMPGGVPVWLVTGYAEARAALADPRLSKRMPGWHPEPDSIVATMDLHMLNSDPPDHGRLRRLVNKAFTARQVERLRPRITAITTGLLDDMADQGAQRGQGAQKGQSEVDLLASFAFPLPITVICELLGVPAADRDDFRAWSATIVSNTAAPEVFQAHATAMIRYFTALLAAKRREPGDDLLSALIAARDEEDSLSENELVSMAFLLLVAGHETTVNLIASGTLALLENPAQWEMLRGNPALINSAVEELLRFVNPLETATERYAREDLQVAGVTIPRGSLTLAALASANRDSAKFADPDHLDITRQNNHHLAFGNGPHYCLGAPLARLEGQIAMNALVQRLPNLKLAVATEKLRWRATPMLRGLEALPVKT